MDRRRDDADRLEETLKDKQTLIKELREEYDRWEGLLAGMDEDQIAAPLPSSAWSIKDVIAHLRAWQQISIARLEAAWQDKEPEFPEWLQGTDPFEADTEQNRDEFNDRIWLATRRQPWLNVHHAWRDGFLRLLELREAIPEDQMTDTKRYVWQRGYPLSSVLEGSCEHHQEHFDSLPPRAPRRQTR